MSAQKSTYLRSALVQHAVGIPAYAHSGFSVYLALYTSDPTIDDDGVEVSGGSYSRKLIDWGTEADGVLPSDAAINFTNMPASRVTHWGIHDASSGGNLLYFGPFDIPIDVAAAATFPVASGDLSLSEL